VGARGSAKWDPCGQALLCRVCVTETGYREKHYVAIQVTPPPPLPPSHTHTPPHPAPASLSLYVGNLLQHLETRCNALRRASPTSVQEAGEQARMLISHLIQARRVPTDVAESRRRCGRVPDVTESRHDVDRGPARCVSGFVW
jgi:hypothetical protein